MSQDGSLMDYGQAIREAFYYLFRRYPKVVAIGQGVWSPWYVGNSMKNMDLEFGQGRVVDTPVSELSCTGAAIGAALCGYRPIAVYPRVDFVLYAMDPIVNQAAKWFSMFGARTKCPVTFRCIINRGGEQGAQHSQALQSWFAHVPGLRVVMPYSPQDARDLLIASVLSDDPVLYLDDRWLYPVTASLPPIVEKKLADEGPKIIREGEEVTLVGCGFSTQLCLEAAGDLEVQGISAEVVDLRILNPLDLDNVIQSVIKTGRICVVDAAWRTCGMAGEVVAGVVEKISPTVLKARPCRLTLPDAPAPSSGALEENYYFKKHDISSAVIGLMTQTVGF